MQLALAEEGIVPGGGIAYIRAIETLKKLKLIMLTKNWY